MSKLTKQFTNNFTIIGNQFFNKLTMQELAMYTYLLSRPEDWNLSSKGTASDTGWGLTQIASAMTGLEKKGLLLRKKYQNPKGQWEWDFEIRNEINQIDNRTINTPSSEQPFTEKPSSGFPVTENYMNINNTIKIKKINKKDKYNNKQSDFDFISEINGWDISQPLKDVTIDFFKNKEVVHKKKITDLMLKRHKKLIDDYTEDGMVEATNTAIYKNYQAVYPAEHTKKTAILGIKQTEADVLALCIGDAKILLENWLTMPNVKKTEALLSSVAYILYQKTEQEQKKIINFALQTNSPILRDFISQQRSSQRAVEPTYGSFIKTL